MHLFFGEEKVPPKTEGGIDHSCKDAFPRLRSYRALYSERLISVTRLGEAKTSTRPLRRL